jgi:hypothetical protein
MVDVKRPFHNDCHVFGYELLLESPKEHALEQVQLNSEQYAGRRQRSGGWLSIGQRKEE